MTTPTSEISPARAARSAADIRGWIVRELAASLKVEPAAIDAGAPLETLGLDSLAAIGMTGGLAGWLGRDLPATLLWDYPSIDAIADALADQDVRPQPAVRPGVVDLQPQGDRTPVFFLPGRGGHPVTFAALASHLGPSQPCFGLTVPGLKGEREPLTRMQDIAAAVIQSIRLVQPAGPYQLVGYSFGGLLAYEIAQQLTAAGQTVAVLALFDTFAPGARTERPRWQRTLLHAYLLATRPGSHFRHLRARLQLHRDAAPSQSPARGVDDDDTTDFTADAEERLNELSRINAQAAAEYQPRPYPGTLLLFRATDRAAHNVFFKSDPLHGWSPLARGGVQAIDLPGSHLRLLDAHHAAAAASALAPHLASRC